MEITETVLRHFYEHMMTIDEYKDLCDREATTTDELAKAAPADRYPLEMKLDDIREAYIDLHVTEAMRWAAGK